MFAKSVFAFVFIFTAYFSLPTMAQESENCSPETLNSIIADSYQNFTENVGDAEGQEYLEKLQIFRDTLTELIEGCPLQGNTAISTNPGSGAFRDPFRFGVNGNIDDGMALKVVGVLRPADTIIRGYNMFNDRPSSTQEYVIVKVEVFCLEDGTSSCSTNYFDYKLVGKNGVVYDFASVVNDNDLDVELFPGASGTGDLVFLIDSSDTELELIYQARFGGSSEGIFFEAEPSPDSGLSIVSVSSVNIRSSPSTNAGVVGTLQPNVSVLAFGRNEDATWVQTAIGWVFADLVTIDGNIQDLPVTSN